MSKVDLTGEGPRIRLCKEGMLESYLQYASYQESPLDFHMWTCISMMAIALGRNCYVNWGAWQIFPNLFIILVGESAITHKSTAIRMGVKPMRNALQGDVHGTAQKMSPEALIKYMTTLSKEHGEAVAYLNVSELSVLLGKQKLDDSLIKLLTDLWDSDDEHTSFTINRGEETIYNICLNMIAGTTPDWLKNSVPIESLEGGFFSRLILVQRPPTGTKNSRPMMKPEHTDALNNFIHDLSQLRKLAGNFTITPDGERAYDNWYYNHNHPEKAESFMRGYFGRKGDFVLKVAMIMSASISDRMEIEARHINAAITILDENEEWTKDIVKFMGTTDTGAKYVKVLSKIKNNVVTYDKTVANRPKPITVVGIDHSKLLRSLSHQLGAEEIAAILDGMIQSKEVERMMAGRKTIYIYKGASLADQDEVESKNKEMGNEG